MVNTSGMYSKQATGVCGGWRGDPLNGFSSVHVVTTRHMRTGWFGVDGATPRYIRSIYNPPNYSEYASVPRSQPQVLVQRPLYR